MELDDRMYAPLDVNSPALGGGSMERKLKIRMGNVTETSGESEPALAVTRTEYSTSRSLALVIERASAYNSQCHLRHYK